MPAARTRISSPQPPTTLPLPIAVAAPARARVRLFMSPSATTRQELEYRWGLAPQAVLAIGDRLKMVRVDARRNPAQMVKNQSFGNHPTEQFVSESVGGYLLALDRHELPVAETMACRCPKPALIIGAPFDLRPEPLFDGFGGQGVQMALTTGSLVAGVA